MFLRWPTRTARLQTFWQRAALGESLPNSAVDGFSTFCALLYACLLKTIHERLVTVTRGLVIVTLIVFVTSLGSIKTSQKVCMRLDVVLFSSLYLIGYRGALPVALLEECHRAFYERMREKMRKVSVLRSSTDCGLDACTEIHIGAISRLSTEHGSPTLTATMRQSSSFTAQNPERCYTSIALRRPRNGREKSNERLRRGPPQDRETHAVVPEEPNGDRTEAARGLQYVKERKGLRVRSETPTRGTKRLRPAQSTSTQGIPLRPRDSNFLARTLSGHTEHGAGHRLNMQSRGDGGDLTGVTLTVVHKPYSIDQRRRMTTDTGGFMRWVGSCNTIHTLRQGISSCQLRVSHVVRAHVISAAYLRCDASMYPALRGYGLPPTPTAWAFVYNFGLLPSKWFIEGDHVQQARTVCCMTSTRKTAIVTECDRNPCHILTGVSP